MAAKEYRILITGPQGVGKSTQGIELAQRLRVPFISTGDEMRAKAKEDSNQGKKIKELLNSGYLIPDEIVADFVRGRISQRDCKKGFVMDGYPRTLSQIKAFDPRFTVVFSLEAPDQVVIQRMIEFRKREDDTPEQIAQRLQIFHEQTEPILKYYANQGILHRINGVKSILEIRDEIRKILGV